MAKATVKEIKPENPPLEITLKLSVEEAATIAAILGAVRGEGHLSAQCVKIYWALTEINPRIINLAEKIHKSIQYNGCDLNIGHIFFKE